MEVDGTCSIVQMSWHGSRGAAKGTDHGQSFNRH
jgi:hypothetical protein